MEIKERIEAYCEKYNEQLPWPYGMACEASKKAQTTWNTLNQVERLAISKHNPFKTDRNMIIKDLNRKGIPQRVLCEMSGLSMSVIKIVTLKIKKKK